MRCYECGKVMEKVNENLETYECECGYAVKRLTREESKPFVRVSSP